MNYTEISGKTVRSGTNVNASATLKAFRVVGHSTSTTHIDPIDRLYVTGVTLMAGITSHDIDAGVTGDVHDEGTVPVESDGSATIAAGDYLVPVAANDSTDGRVKTAAAGTLARCIGRAVTPAAATAGAIVMCKIDRSIVPVS